LFQHLFSHHHELPHQVVLVAFVMQWRMRVLPGWLQRILDRAAKDVIASLNQMVGFH
jgi:ABC-type enterochelin transport system permease subunit